MIDTYEKGSPLYVKKKIIVTRNVDLQSVEDDILSMKSNQFDVIIEEKTCTLSESSRPYQMPSVRSEKAKESAREKESVKEKETERQPEETTPKENTVDSSIVKHLRTLGSAMNFRAMVKNLMRKRTDTPVVKGRFKPELYHRDFMYYFTQHKLIIMLKADALKRIRMKLTRNTQQQPNTTRGYQTETFNEQSSFLSNPVQLSIASTKREKPHQPAGKTNVLTKIPKKVPAVSVGNKRLDMAYTKAKDAARVVRRLEYSYNMKMNIMFSKPIHKANAKLLQKWWREIKNKRLFTPHVIKIQRIFKGSVTRRAFKETLRFIQYLPFTCIIHSTMYYKLNHDTFDDLFFKFGINAINSIIIPKANMLVRKVKSYLVNRTVIIPRTYHVKCLYTRRIFDNKTSTALHKLQGFIKMYLMKNNERVMLYHSHQVHPFLFFYLKYGNKIYKRKILKFRQHYLRMKEFKLQANKKLESRYDYLPYIIKKAYWKKLKEMNETAKLKDNNKPIKKRLMRKVLKKNDKKNLRNAFIKYKSYNEIYKKFILPQRNSFLRMMVKILKNKINVYNALFMSKLKSFVCNRPTKREAMHLVLKLKEAYSPLSETYLNKYFQVWKHKAKTISYNKSKRKLKGFMKKTTKKYRLGKAIKQFYLNSLVKTAQFYKGTSLLEQKLKMNLSRLVYIKIRGIKFRERTEWLLNKTMLHKPKTRFNHWRFENKKYHYAMKEYVSYLKKRTMGLKRKEILITIQSKLHLRLTAYFLRRAFIRYRKNTGVYYKRPITRNLQIYFLNHEKKYLEARKHRLFKYTVNKMTSGQENLSINSKMLDQWDMWKDNINDYRREKILFKIINSLHTFILLMKRKCLMSWRKKNLLLKQKDIPIIMKKNKAQNIHKKRNEEEEEIDDGNNISFR